MDKSKEQHCSSSHPLFSVLVTSSLLALLYSPNVIPLLLSPVLISTSLLLATLLHFGPSEPESRSHQKLSSDLAGRIEPEVDSVRSVVVEQKTECFCDSLVEWGRRGVPLDVIYEEFEGEEEEEEEDDEEEEEEEEEEEGYSMEHCPPKGRPEFMGFCETDTSSDSSLSVSENMRWWEEEEEEGGNGMIEIALEEDNLIELDLTACR